MCQLLVPVPCLGQLHLKQGLGVMLSGNSGQRGRHIPGQRRQRCQAPPSGDLGQGNHGGILSPYQVSFFRLIK